MASDGKNYSRDQIREKKKKFADAIRPPEANFRPGFEFAHSVLKVILVPLVLLIDVIAWSRAILYEFRTGHLTIGAIKFLVKRFFTLGLLNIIPLSEKPEKEALKKLFGPSEQLKIAVAELGSMGDCIHLSRFVSAIHVKYPGAMIFVFDRMSKFHEVFRDNNAVTARFILEWRLGDWTLDWLLEKGFLDLYFENRYVVKSKFGKNSKISMAEQQDLKTRFEDFNVNFKEFPIHNNILGNFAKEAGGLTQFDLTELTSNTPVNSATPAIKVRSSDRQKVQSILGGARYVTIHHGAFTPDHYRSDSVTQTKNWAPEKWAIVVDFLKTKGLEVVQLGIRGEEAIVGADASMIGQLTFHETAAVLERSALHLDTEGGVVHLASAVGTRSLVLFGPTPAQFFGYKNNINIQKGNCSDCWWSKVDWMTKCPIGKNPPVCMSNIEPKDVIESLSRENLNLFPDELSGTKLGTDGSAALGTTS